MTEPKRADPSPSRKRSRRPKPIRSKAAFEVFLYDGGRIVKTLPKELGDPTYWVDPETDRVISSRLVKWAMEKGLLRGCGDGLFDDTSQTFEARA